MSLASQTTVGSGADRDVVRGRENAIAVTLGLIGDEWNLLIVRTAIAGARRYHEWQDRLGIANSVLTARLRALTAAGVLERIPYQERPVRHEYLLTAAGRALWPVLLTTWSWELHHVRHPWPIEEMRHGPCAHAFTPVLTCAACGLAAGVHDVTGRFGPSGSYARSVPVEKTRRRVGGVPTGPGLYPETMALIGNRWSAATLAAAFQGAHRFTDFARRLSAPPTIVADRLRRFCELGVLAPVAAERADRNSYHLTVKGRAFFPVIMVSIAWGQRWFPDRDGPAMLFTHHGCGRPFVPLLACSRCDLVLRGADIIVGAGRAQPGREALGAHG